MRFAAIGLDHRHIYHMVGELLAEGAACAGYCPVTTDPRVLEGFRTRFPDLVPVERERLFDDPGIDIILSAAVPKDRAGIAIRAMRAGKDVMVDKPGIVTAEDLIAVEAAARETGRIFSICFSERFTVPANVLAGKLLADGAIGRLVQTCGLGPHRLNKAIRPAWFFDSSTYGGILVDIGSHHIDQYIHYARAPDARIVHSTVGHFGDETADDFEDFGEITFDGGGATGYLRVDWFTPDGLATWGDGRMFMTGTEGAIEIRKYIDVEGRPGGDHIFLIDRKGSRHIDASREPLTYFRDFLADVRDRTERSMSRAHPFTVSRLALEAQARARRIGALPQR